MEKADAVKISERIDLGIATLSLREDGIINTDVKVEDAVTLEQAEKILKAYISLSKGRKTPNLITLQMFVIMENDVMRYLLKNTNRFGLADAFVIRSLPQKIMCNFYLKYHKPEVPTKLFTSEQNAIDWLRGFL